MCIEFMEITPQSSDFGVYRFWKAYKQREYVRVPPLVDSDSWITDTRFNHTIPTRARARTHARSERNDRRKPVLMKDVRIRSFRGSRFQSPRTLTRPWVRRSTSNVEARNLKNPKVFHVEVLHCTCRCTADALTAQMEITAEGSQGTAGKHSDLFVCI